jgi:hypothetical protein
LHSNAPLPPPFLLLEALFKWLLWYHLQVIHHIRDDVFRCLKPSSFKGKFEFREQKKSQGDRSGEKKGCGRVGIECFTKNRLTDTAVWAGALLWGRSQLPAVHISGCFCLTVSCRLLRSAR